MTEPGRVALMAAVRRIASTEGGDRFESLSQRDIRLQLPAALSAGNLTPGLYGSAVNGACRASLQPSLPPTLSNEPSLAPAAA